MASNFTCVILSGGSGTRLWPASREARPKPFIKLADGETLIHKTYARAKELGSEVLTVTNRDYLFMSKDEQERVGIPGRFLLEPFGRNTAPAIALAAKYIESIQGKDAVMLIMAADHLITNQCEFDSAVMNAVKMAKQDYLVTFGILPTSPEVGFGYIELGEVLSIGNKVTRFIEKPNLIKAEKFVASGNYLWNSGMFCFKAGKLLNELNKYAPEVARGVHECWERMQPLNSAGIFEIPADDFKKIPEISIDYAVMEKSDSVAVVRGSFTWNDIGSWSSVRDFVEPDAFDNRIIGEVMLVDSKNTFVQSESRLVAAVGTRDLIIIDTPDALLVAHADKAQKVKEVAGQLKAGDHAALKLHRTVTRPWGSYAVLEEGNRFKIKRIEVKPGGCLSLQLHKQRSEHWVVVNGVAKITNGDTEIIIRENESTYIPAGQKHRLENAGENPCVLIEVQCGAYLGEDDIVRFEDKYGR